jgi:hypothetical protein
LIEPGDKLTGLSCGAAEFNALKTFLQRDAKLFHERHLARTYGTFLKKKVIAYISLVCGEVVAADANKVEEEGLNFNYGHYPAVKIARLLVDSRYREKGYRIGEELVKLALGTIKGVRDSQSPDALKIHLAPQRLRPAEVAKKMTVKKASGGL